MYLKMLQEKEVPMKKIRTAALVILAAAGLTITVPATSAAAVGDMVCTLPGSETITYSPALTLSPQTVNITVNRIFTSCTSSTNPAITSGTSSTTLKGVPGRSCLTLLGSGSARHTITWNTGATSTLAENYSAQIIGGVYSVTVTGTVISGLFAGDTVVREVAAPSTDIVLCLLGFEDVDSIYATTTLLLN